MAADNEPVVGESLIRNEPQLELEPISTAVIVPLLFPRPPPYLKTYLDSLSPKELFNIVSICLVSAIQLRLTVDSSPSSTRPDAARIILERAYARTAVLPTLLPALVLYAFMRREKLYSGRRSAMRCTVLTGILHISRQRNSLRHCSTQDQPQWGARA